MATFSNGELGLSVRTKINNVLQHADGTAGEIVFNDAGADVDFRVESDTNAGALFVDGATGNVGIGTDSPTALGGNITTVDIAGPSAAGIRLRRTAATTTNAFVLATSGEFMLSVVDALSMTFRTTNTERMRIDASGNVGIGTASPTAIGGSITTVDIAGPAGGGIRFRRTTATGAFVFSYDAEFRLGVVDAQPMTFLTTNIERMRIDSSGNLLIGTTATGASKLRISGLPTSAVGLSAGDVWNDGGTLKIA